MSFDLNTAKPVTATTKFDLNTARPVASVIPASEPPQNTDVIGSFVQRRPDGQLVIPTDGQTTPDLATMSFPEWLGTNVMNSAEDFARPVGGGIRNIVAGVASLPAEIAEAFGRPRSPMIDSFVKNLPVVEQNGAVGELVQALTQYVAPAVGAAGLVPSAAKNAPTVAKVASGALKTVAASLADMLVTDPNQASTLGDMIGIGPTEIDPGDSNLMKRVKVGAETPIAEGLLAGVKGIGGFIGDMWNVNKARVDPARQKQLAEQLVMQSASDPAKAAADIAATRATVDPNGAFKPTGPESSKDIGLLQLQRGVAQDPRMVARQQGNAEAIIDSFEQGVQRTDPTDANFENITKFAKNTAQQQMAPAQADLARAQQRGAQIDQRIQTQADELAAQKAAGPSASAQIAEADKLARQKVTAEKNRLYDPKTLDPENALKGDPTPLLEAADAIKPRPGQGAEADIPSDIRTVLDELRGDNPTDMSFEYLSNLRTKVSGAIKAAVKEGDKGGLVDNLTKLKGAVNEEIAKFAEQSQPLREADQYYKDTASPLLREGTGGKLTRAEQAGQPMAPTEVGRAYLGKGPAARERVADFNRMLAQVDNPKDVETAARDWLVSDLARTVDGKLTPERIQKWMENKDVAEILNGRPDVKKEVGQMLNRIRAKSGVKKRIEQEILDKTATVQKTQKEINESALGQFLPAVKDGKSPNAATVVADILGGDNVRQNMRKLIAEVKQDTTGEALEGLKDAVRKYISGKVTPIKTGVSGKTLETRRVKVRYNELSGIMHDPNMRAVLEDIYGANSKELRNFNKVLNEIEILGTPEIVQGTTGSSTKPIEENAKRTTTTLAAIMSQNFRQNRILNIMASWLPDQSQQAIRGYMIEMILDPRMSETLMLKQTEANAARIEKELRTYVTNNILGSGEDRRQDNQKDDTMPPKGENK